MRNRIFLIGSIALSLLTACSSDEDIAAGSGEIKVTPGNSDVKIQLSTGSGGTRAALNSDENGCFDVEGLGIFCLANGQAQGATQPAVLDWSAPTDPIKQYSAWMCNVYADAATTDNVTDIVFKDDSGNAKDYYYPLANWHTYQFYGYYPRVEDDNLSYGTNSVSAKIPIDGKSDIIWGKTNGDPNENAYCAKYFRTEGHGSETPVMNFEHKLMQLQFRCKPGKKDGEVDAGATSLIIKNIKVTNVPAIARLTIANQMTENTSFPSGRLYCQGSDGMQELKVFGKDDAELTPVTVGEDTENPQAIGQGLLVPVLDKVDNFASNGHYDIELELVHSDGTPLGTYPAIRLNAGEGENGVFTKPGKIYYVDIVIYSPTDIRLQAKLNQWETDDTITEIEY